MYNLVKEYKHFSKTVTLRDRKDSSNESLLQGSQHETVASFHQKVRKISGNLSEISHNSSAKVEGGLKKMKGVEKSLKL